MSHPIRVPNGTTLTQDQEGFLEACFEALSERGEFQGAGSAGTGKTFLMKLLVGHFLSQGKTVHVAAPTHKALRVLREKLGELASKAKASTLHSLFGLKPVHNASGRVFKRDPHADATDFGRGDVLVCDEASMNEAKLEELIQEAKERWSLLVVKIGDRRQLPPVDPGSSGMPSLASVDYEMTQIVRQEKGNPVITMATVLRDTAMLDLTAFRERAGETRREGSGIWFYDRQKAWTKKLVKLCSHQAWTKDNNFGRALAFRNDTVEDVIRAVRRSKLGLEAKRKPYVEGEWLIAQAPWAQSPKSPALFQNSTEMQVVSCSESEHLGYNCLKLKVRGAASGKTTTVFAPDPSRRGSKWRREVRSLKGEAIRSGKGWDWKKHYEAKEALADLRHAYATTVHKSQGSTFEHVFVHWRDLRVAAEVSETNPQEVLRALQYVAVTRTAKTVHILA